MKFFEYQPENLLPMGTLLNCAQFDLAPAGPDAWVAEYLIPFLQDMLRKKCEIASCENPEFMVHWTAIMERETAGVIANQSDIFLFHDGAHDAGMGILFYREDNDLTESKKRTIYRAHIPVEPMQEQLIEACSHLRQLDGHSAKAYRQVYFYLLAILDERRIWERLDLELDVDEGRNDCF